jgi:hypothetical protein
MPKTTEVALSTAKKNKKQEFQRVTKPSEIVSASPIEGKTLSLPAVKCYNLMLGIAQAAGFADQDYCISKHELRRSHKSNERLDGLLNELHSIVLEMRCNSPRGKPATLRTPLLSATIHEDDEDDGNVYFSFPPKLIKIIEESDQWSILLAQVMVGFKSLYALRLYEYGCGYYKRDEPFWWMTPDELRKSFSVPDKTYDNWAILRLKVLDAAIKEVNTLAEEFEVDLPEDKIRRHGRKVVKFCLVFKAKHKPVEEQKDIKPKLVQTGIDINDRALRILQEAARSHGPGQCPAVSRWYKLARERGCSSVLAYAARHQWPEWVAWVAQDIIKAGA